MSCSWGQAFWLRRRTKGRTDARPFVARLRDSLLSRFCTLDKRSHIIVELLQDPVIHIDHVPGLVVLVADVRLQRLRNWQMMHLVLAFKVWGRQIVVAARQ